MKRKPLWLILSFVTASPLFGQVFWDFLPNENTAGQPAVDLKEIFEQTAIGEGDGIRVEGDDFVHATTGEKIRFWGVNVNKGSNTPDAAALYARRGVNGVRYHSRKVIADVDSPDLFDIDAQTLDDLHKAIASFGEEGIYTFISEVYFPLSFKIQPEWGIDGYEDGTSSPFFVQFFDEKLKGAFKEWLRRMLVAENPYNGRTIAEDPAVAAIELVNEDNLFFWTFSSSNVPAVQWAKVESAMYEFVVEKYGSYEEAVSAWGSLGNRFRVDDPDNGRLRVLSAGAMTLDQIRNQPEADQRRIADQVEFLATTQRNWFEEMEAVLRENGFEGGVISTNWKTAESSSSSEDRYLRDVENWTYTGTGILDTHNYFNPVSKDAESGLLVSSGDKAFALPAVNVPRRLSVAVKQVEGYPSIVSEFAWTTPNPYRPEATLMIAAYSALNDVDAVFWFASEGPRWHETQQLTTWPVNIPTKLGLFPAASLIYRKGLVDEGPAVVREGKKLAALFGAEPSLVKAFQGSDITRDPDGNGETPGAENEAVGSLSLLAGRVDLAFDRNEDFVHPDLPDLINDEEGYVQSVTGQLRTDFVNGVLTVDSPFAQATAGFLDEAGTVALSDVRLRGKNQFGSLVVVSLDGLPIAQSNRLLIQSGTFDRLTGWETRDWTTTIDDVAVQGFEVLSVGTPPWQVEKTDAQVTLQFDDREVERAVALSPTLETQTPLRPLAVGGSIRLTLPEDALYTVVELVPLANTRPTITSSALPNAIIEEPYEFLLEAVGGEGNLRWSAESLPEGLNLTEEGLLQGTPTSTGTGSLALTVTDEDGDVQDLNLPFQVIDFSGGSLPDESPWAEVPLENGWKDTPIGWLADEAFPFTFHLQHGWMFVLPVGEETFQVYNFQDDLGWMFVLESTYPSFLYHYERQSWLAFLDEVSEDGKRWFFDYSIGTQEEGWFSVGGN